MKPFKLYKFILLLLTFSINNLYAVKTATVDQVNTETVATISTTKAVKDSPKKAKRKSRLIERVKAKFSYLFEQDNTVQNENLETHRLGFATASLVLGIVGVITAVTGFGLIASLLAIIFGAIAKKKIKNSGGFYTGKGMANAGLVLGIIPMAFFVIVLIALMLSGF